MSLCPCGPSFTSKTLRPLAATEAPDFTSNFTQSAESGSRLNLELRGLIEHPGASVRSTHIVHKNKTGVFTRVPCTLGRRGFTSLPTLLYTLLSCVGPHRLNAIRIIRTFCNTVPSRVYIALGDAQLYESMGFTKYTFPWC